MSCFEAFNARVVVNELVGGFELMFSLAVGGEGFTYGGVGGFLDDFIVVNIVAEFG